METIWVIFIIFFVVLGLCAAAGYVRRFLIKAEWAQRKATKDSLKAQIEAGDTDPEKQKELDILEWTTEDEFFEPNMNEWTDYALWYVAEPVFGMFVERFDKFFLYTGWVGNFLDIIVNLWIVSGLYSAKNFACCHDANAAPECDPNVMAEGSLEDIDVSKDGYCRVPSQGGRIVCGCSWPDDVTDPVNDAVCGKEALKTAMSNAALWLLIVILIKLVQIGWDYYITILGFMNEKKHARDNLAIIEAWKEKNPYWEPDAKPEARRKSVAAPTTEDKNEGTELNEDDKEANNVTTEDGDKTEDVDLDNDIEAGDGPQLKEREEVRICGCILGGISSKNEHYTKFLTFFMVWGTLLTFITLYGLDQGGGIGINGCNANDENCQAIAGKCADPGQIEGISSENSERLDAYLAVHAGVNFDGPAIVAILAQFIGYIAYVPWIRSKIHQICVEKGWKKGESEADAVGDFNAWSGFL